MSHAYFGDKGGAKKLAKLLGSSARSKALEKKKDGEKSRKSFLERAQPYRKSN